MLAAKPVAASDDAFLDRLSAHGVDAHHRFAQALAAEEIEVAADDFDDLNGAFYKWQQRVHLTQRERVTQSSNFSKGRH